ncbi:MAG: outer membrane lipid asymmetry maintenance protein MlaD [Pelagibacteraceae bacterium]|nr:MAG: outer membrane lipid asymmetry maintenance protein MlaD [Pelagibacteraceae bacterium]
MNNKISFEFIIGLLILIITLISFFYFSLKIDYFDNSKKINLNSNFFDIGDLTVGADVKTKGVKIGEVIEISLDGNSYMAIVKSSLNYDLKIPLDSEFKIANNGFIGSPYIEVTMGINEQYYQNNDLTENNVDAVSLEEIINSFIFN